MIKLTALLVAMAAQTPVPCSTDPAAVKELTHELSRRLAPEQRPLKMTVERLGGIAGGQCSVETRRDLAEQAVILEEAILKNKNADAAQRVLSGALLNLIR